jgi:hypothetical protein
MEKVKKSRNLEDLLPLRMMPGGLTLCKLADHEKEYCISFFI